MLRKHSTTMGPQWDEYLSGILWAYRNTPHDSTGEKPSFLLFGMDCRSPSEAALLPPASPDNTVLGDYREELMLNLSSARKLAQTTLQRALKCYKNSYDKHCHPNHYQLGDWILIRFPQDETGKDRKLSKPWHGPYRVVQCEEPNVVATKVYFLDDGPIHVHQTRTTRCPPEFQNGYYWYGSKQCSSNRYPRWIDEIHSCSQTERCHDASETNAHVNDNDPPPAAEPQNDAALDHPAVPTDPVTYRRHPISMTPPPRSSQDSTQDRHHSSSRYPLRKTVRLPKRYW